MHGTPYFFRFESNPTISRQLDGNTAESFLAYCHARGIETVWYPTQNKGFGRMQSPTKRVLYAIQARANRCGMSATEELGMTALPSSR